MTADPFAVGAPTFMPARMSPRHIEAIVQGLLSAHRVGTVQQVLERRARLARRLLMPVLPLLEGVWGDSAPQEANQRLFLAVRAVTVWLLGEMRPDRGTGLDAISDEAWLYSTSWRPLLATACQLGLCRVPHFPKRYLGSEADGPIEHLCTLWDVGPSTLYRYLEKGRQQLGRQLGHQLGATQRGALRACALQILRERCGPAIDAEWHARQVRWATSHQYLDSALWHCLESGDWAAAVELLMRSCTQLAGHVDTPVALGRLEAAPMAPPTRAHYALALAALRRASGDSEEERRCLEQALAQAAHHGLYRLEGQAMLALGNYFQSRDLDRALVFFQDGADKLASLGSEESEDDRQDSAMDLHLRALDRLAWVYALRNDGRALAVLRAADERKSHHAVSDSTRATLENTWGEYWRRAGDRQQELEHKLRALLLFERVGDARQILSTSNNLSVTYGELGRFDEAIRYAQRVVQGTSHQSVEPFLLAGATGNLGIAYFRMGKLSEAIRAYLSALETSQTAGLGLLVTRMHYNLAEAFFRRFKESGDPADEIQGDHHVECTLQAKAGEHDPYVLDAARRLKSEVLGLDQGFSLASLVPDEHAAHASHMARIQQHRQALAMPGSAETKIKLHLEIAQSYLEIAAVERDAALALMQRSGLDRQFAPELDRLQDAFKRQMPREQQVQSQWRERAGELLAEQRRIAILEHLFTDGSIQKSTYARLCGVGLATASKHLVTLAERGLLLQTGKGPSTRYVLPADIPLEQ
ncbi:MAG: tetratricopeptide repeat protein [Pseudomonadota bacterium]